MKGSTRAIKSATTRKEQHSALSDGAYRGVNLIPVRPLLDRNQSPCTWFVIKVCVVVSIDCRATSYFSILSSKLPGYLPQAVKLVRLDDGISSKGSSGHARM